MLLGPRSAPDTPPLPPDKYQPPSGFFLVVVATCLCRTWTCIYLLLKALHLVAISAIVVCKVGASLCVCECVKRCVIKALALGISSAREKKLQAVNVLIQSLSCTVGSSRRRTSKS